MVLAAGVVVVAMVLGGAPVGVAAGAPEGVAGRVVVEGAAGRVAVEVAVRVPEEVCRLKDRRLAEASGMVGDGAGGFVVVNDGADDPAARRIFFLDGRCKVTRTVGYPSLPRDTEDLGRGPDGTLWVADIGDNGRSRETVAVWRLAPGARRPALFRLSYPDGAHDAEALLVGADGVPVVVTKDPMTAGIYVPDGELRRSRVTPLRRAGEFRIPGSGTSNPFGFAGRLVVTGGAVSADGRRVAVRTYADAFVFEAPDGDVVRAVSEGEPQVVAMPDEPQGEAVAFGSDGVSLLSASEVGGQSGRRAAVLRYPLPAVPGNAVSAAPSAAPAGPDGSRDPADPGDPRGAVASSAAGAADGAPAGGGGRPAAVAQESGVPAGAVAAAGVLVVAGAGLGVVLARRRRSSRGATDAGTG